MTRTIRWIIITAVFLTAAGAGIVYRYAHGSMSYLFCRLAFDYYLARDSRELKEEARSGLSSTYYFTSYYLNGMISAAEGTGSDRIMRRIVRIMDTMLSTAQEYESHGRTYYAWRPFSITADSTIMRPNLHFTFQSTVPIARTAAVIMTHPRWKKKYESAARRYVAYVDQSIVRYWYHDQLRDTIPWVDPDHFPIWNDNCSNLGLITVFLYRATGNPEYLAISQRIGGAFKAKLAFYRRGWIWENQKILIGSDTDNTPGSVGNRAGVPDTSHTNREAFLMTMYHEAGLLFTRADLARMADTLTGTLWNGSTENPSFANYLNGSDEPYRVYKKPGLNGSIYHGWVLMGGYSPEAQNVMICTLKAIVRGRMNPALERNATSYGGMLALSGHLLRNFAVRERNDHRPSPHRDAPRPGIVMTKNAF